MPGAHNYSDQVRGRGTRDQGNLSGAIFTSSRPRIGVGSTRSWSYFNPQRYKVQRNFFCGAGWDVVGATQKSAKDFCSFWYKIFGKLEQAPLLDRLVPPPANRHHDALSSSQSQGPSHPDLDEPPALVHEGILHPVEHEPGQLLEEQHRLLTRLTEHAQCPVTHPGTRVRRRAHLHQGAEERRVRLEEVT